jgi:hypothetical protein
MTDDYTPSPEETRERYAASFPDREYARAEFDRMLTAHDAATRAEWEAEQGGRRYLDGPVRRDLTDAEIGGPDIDDAIKLLRSGSIDGANALVNHMGVYLTVTTDREDGSIEGVPVGGDPSFGQRITIREDGSRDG